VSISLFFRLIFTQLWRDDVIEAVEFYLTPSSSVGRNSQWGVRGDYGGGLKPPATGDHWGRGKTPKARGSMGGSPIAGRFLQFFNKNNAFLCLFFNNALLRQPKYVILKR